MCSEVGANICSSLCDPTSESDLLSVSVCLIAALTAISPLHCAPIKLIFIYIYIYIYIFNRPGVAGAVL